MTLFAEAASACKVTEPAVQALAKPCRRNGRQPGRLVRVELVCKTRAIAKLIPDSEGSFCKDGIFVFSEGDEEQILQKPAQWPALIAFCKCNTSYEGPV